MMRIGTAPSLAHAYRRFVQHGQPRNIASVLSRTAPPWVRISLLVLALALAACSVLYPLAGISLAVTAWAAIRIATLLSPKVRKTPERILAVVYFFAAAAVLIEAPAAAPYVIVALLFINTAVSAFSVRSSPKPQLVWDVGITLLFVASGICALVWPDLAWVLVAYVFAFALIRFGFWTALGLFPKLHETPAPSTSVPATSVPATSAPRRFHATSLVAGGLACTLVAFSMVAGSLALQSTNNTLDAFYDYDATNLPTPGTLLRVDNYAGPHPSELTVKRILFSSTDSAGQPTIASGIAAVPHSFAKNSESPQQLPLVLWEHGTNGVASMCALSAGPAALDPQAFPAINHIVENQWAIVAPDFMTHTGPNRSPYLVGQGQAQFALDAVRAARSMTFTDFAEATAAQDIQASTPRRGDIPFTQDTVVWGHSQGGNAALWTAQYAATYAPELPLAGTAALSPAAKPLELGLSLTSESASAAVGIVVSYVLSSYTGAYSDVHPSDHVAHNALPIYEGFASRCTNTAAAGSIITALALQRNGNNVFTNFAPDTALGRHLAANQPAGPFAVPLFVGWGSEDEVISADLQHSYVADLCASGAIVDSVEYSQRTHMDVLHDDSLLPADLAAWTADRFDGVEAISNCM